MYHTCCTDILCIQSIVSVLLENQYIPLEKQKHVSYQFTQMLLQQEFQRIRKRERWGREGWTTERERRIRRLAKRKVKK